MRRRKRKTTSLTDFLAEGRGRGTGEGSTFDPKPVNTTNETSDLTAMCPSLT